MKVGYMRVQLTGADIPGTISYLTHHDIELLDVLHDGALTAELEIRYVQYKQFKELVNRRGNEIQIKRISGFFRMLGAVFHRPVLLLAVTSLLFLTVWLPSRVLFVSVEGNQTVPTTRILQQAERCGIYFGAKRSVVRSEIVKNHLLEALPELQWAGINTKGCTAVIRIREEPRTETKESSAAYSSIVADRDGIITSCTVTSGAAVCMVGDAVRAGQVLISGYQDLGLIVKLTRSQGEVFAQTNRSVELITPISYTKKQEPVEQTTRYSFIIGKKRINLSKDSGISYTGCDKIYSEYYVTLPGGYILPAALAVEHMVAYEKTEVSVDAKEAEKCMEEHADSYLLEQTVSATILEKSISNASSETVNCMTLHYICVEMIGRERPEEMNVYYGKDD